jgi:hypothetical protein
VYGTPPATIRLSASVGIVAYSLTERAYPVASLVMGVILGPTAEWRIRTSGARWWFRGLRPHVHPGETEALAPQARFPARFFAFKRGTHVRNRPIMDKRQYLWA